MSSLGEANVPGSICRCGKRAAIEMRHLSGPLCNACFCRVLEQRVRREIRECRLQGMVTVQATGTASSVVLEHMLQKPAFRRMREVSSSSSAVISPACADEIAAGFLENLFKGAKPLFPEGACLPMKGVLHRECVAYAGIRGLEVPALAESEARAALSLLEEANPGVAFSLAKSVCELRQLE